MGGGGHRRYTEENHTSVVGMRGRALAAGAEVAVTRVSAAAGGWRVSADVLGADDAAHLEASGPVCQGPSASPPDDPSAAGGNADADKPPDNPRVGRCPPRAEFFPCVGDGGAESCGQSGAAAGAEGRSSLRLFALPAECNFTGARRDLAVVAALQARGWMVALDAAKASATSPPDLSRCKPEFVVLSFYKARCCAFPLCLLGSAPLGISAQESRLLAARPRYPPAYPDLRVPGRARGAPRAARRAPRAGAGQGVLWRRDGRGHRRRRPLLRAAAGRGGAGGRHRAVPLRRGREARRGAQSRPAHSLRSPHVFLCE